MNQIDIILPFYNCSRFIGPQLHSIFENCLNSSVKVQVLIIDDCSELSESAKLNSICEAYRNVTIHRNDKNLGVVGSIERGLALSTSDYIMLCDQDDYWLPHKINLSLAKIKNIENLNPALVFTDLNVVDENLNITHPSMFNLFHFSPEKLKNNILIQNMVTGCTIILNKRLRDLSLPFPNDIVIHDHWLAMCAAYGGEIGFVKEPTILYRQHGRNLIGARKVNTFAKILNLKSVLLKKQKSHIQKSIQTTYLADRLKTRGYVQNVGFLNEISEALESRNLRDVYILRKKKVINFDLRRSVIITSFFILVAVYKTLARMVRHA